MTYLTAQQTADRLNLSLWEVYRLAKSGELRGSQRAEHGAWRFDPADLDAWVAEGENRPRSRKRRRETA